MLEALKGLFSSKKFITAIIALVVAAGAKFGLEVDGEVVAAILGVFAVLIGAQGATDVGKEAAKAKTTMIMLIAIACLSSTMPACSGAKGTAGRVAGDVVDCLTPTAKDAIGTFGPAIADVLRNATSNDGKVDWAPVKAVGKSFKTPAAQCVLAAVVAEALRPKPVDPEAPMSAPLQVDPAELLSGFDALRTELYGGTRYQFGGGVL